MSRLQGIREIKELVLGQLQKSALISVPPHPSHEPPPQGGPPMDPNAMPPQGGPPMDPSAMPPQGGPPMDPNAMPPQGGPPMDPNAMPPPEAGGISPEIAEILQGMTQKIDEVARGSEEQLSMLRQELQELRMEKEKTEVERAARRQTIETLLPTV
jgi:hypothetical protein